MHHKNNLHPSNIMEIAKNILVIEYSTITDTDRAIEERKLEKLISQQQKLEAKIAAIEKDKNSGDVNEKFKSVASELKTIAQAIANTKAKLAREPRTLAHDKQINEYKSLIMRLNASEDISQESTVNLADRCEAISLDDAGRTIIGVRQLVSTAHSQQDRIAYIPKLSDLSASEKLMTLSPQAREQAMKTLFLTLHAHADRKFAGKMAGACANVSTAQRQHNQVQVSTSFVGDSVTVVVVVNRQGKLEHSEVCNPGLHNLHNPLELAVVTKINPDSKRGGRVGGIAVSRTLGDGHADPAGMTHAPDTVQKTWHVDKTDYVIMLTTCDGAYEQILKRLSADAVNSAEVNNMVMNLFAQQVGELVVNHIRVNHQIIPAQLASEMVDNAKSGDPHTISQDDISVVVVPVLEGATPVTVAVFDGHGDAKTGHLVAEFAQQNLSAQLSNVLALHGEIEHIVPENKRKDVIEVIHQLILNKVVTRDERQYLDVELTSKLSVKCEALLVLQQILDAYQTPGAVVDASKASAVQRRALYQKSGTSVAGMFRQDYGALPSEFKKPGLGRP